MDGQEKIPPRQEVKYAHESRVIEQFTKYYNSITGMQFAIIHRPKIGGSESPDAILKSENTFLWIEHADLYRSADEAREEYSFATPGEKRFIHGEHPICQPDERIATAIIKRLEAKLSKESYSDCFRKYGEGILILTERDPLFSESTLECIHRELENYEFLNDRGYFKIGYMGYRSENDLIFEGIYHKQ